MDDKQNDELVVVRNTKPPSDPGNVSKEQQAKNLVVSGVNSIPVVGKVFGEITSQVLRTGEYSREQQLRNLQFDWLVKTLPPVLNKIEVLLEEGVNVESPDIGAIFEAALDASRKTTGKKREYLKNALENAFSLKVYEEGQVLRFFKILGGLEYGDVLFLESFVRRPVIPKTKDGLKHLPSALKRHYETHANYLLKQGLIKDHSPLQWKILPIGSDFIWFVTADDEDLEPKFA